LPDAGESPVLRAWADGRIDADAAFAALYDTYAPMTRGWLAVRAPAADVDDLFQDVWSIFLRRWREWTPPDTISAADPRPVLSFLFRTCHLALLAQRRLAAAHTMQPIEAAPEPDVDGDRIAVREVQFGECLAAARACCDDTELAVLTAKLSGVSGRETARTLGLTEPAVDHRYRAAIARIRERLAGPPQEAGHDL
jgi:DNA-directed RNA polymerase specialized sigma24 family protein